MNLKPIAIAWAAAGLAVAACAGETCGQFANPICEQADPWITQYQGQYLACFSEANRGITVQQSDQLTVLGRKHVVWWAPERGPASREVWAPELHLLGHHWYIYFAASDGQNRNHRAWALRSDGIDPLGPYTLNGPLYTGDDLNLLSNNCWAIDMTVLDLRGKLYAIWSGWPDQRDLQYLYIAPMSDPVTVSGPRVRLCANNDYPWERVGESPQQRGLNEAPEVLEHDGRIFVTYSCSGSWQPTYKIGLLELKPGADPLQLNSWIKHPLPAFASTTLTFGVGHNSFVKSPDGSEDWLIYHAKLDRDDGWRRAVFAQPFTWNPDGTPNLGQPVASGELLRLPSGERTPVITGERHFHFDALEDLLGWSYYGHHQFMRIGTEGLSMGESVEPPINGFRSGEKVVLNGGHWTNFTLTAKIRSAGDRGQAGVLFRVDHPFLGYNGQDGYFAGINGQSRLTLGCFDGKSWRQIAFAPLDKPVGDEFELTVMAQDKEIEVQCDGQLLLRVSDGTFKSGTIGLRVVDGHAAFSNMQISPR